MALRRPVVLLLAAACASLGASYQTPNFTVEAPTPQIAQQVGQYAEHYRREKALEWVGREMPRWPEPCPLRVKVTMSGAGGATSFAFDQGQVLGQQMNIEGSLDRILASVLPHEVTHTVFAHHFRHPVPRWADEGGAVLSEDEVERNRHDQLVRQILNQGRAIPLRRLFSLKEYPSDVMCLYAQGFSVANFLVSNSNRSTFLNFVGDGMQYGWDHAVQTYYRYQSVEEMEQAWLSHLRSTRRPPAGILASNTPPASANPANRVVVRLTAPPVQPLQDAPPGPVFRAQAPGPEQDYAPPIPQAPTHPGGQAFPPAERWQPAQPPPQSTYPPPGARLGPPQFGTPAPPAPAMPGPRAPVGYPN
jgi:hypothetical protein